jgi:hypothetical protein
VPNKFCLSLLWRQCFGIILLFFSGCPNQDIG